ncbi:unnamed protein product, partial [marine sediment metagenome]
MNKKERQRSIKEAIEKTVLDSDLWADNRKLTHGFILSPDVYVLTRDKQKELKEIGLSLYDCLIGLGKIADMTANSVVASGRTWGMIGRVLRTGI